MMAETASSRATRDLRKLMSSELGESCDVDLSSIFRFIVSTSLKSRLPLNSLALMLKILGVFC